MSSRSEVRIAGPLAAFAPGFGGELERRGYRPSPAADRLRLMADASGWLCRRLAGGDLALTEVRVAQVMSERRAAGRWRLLSPRAMRPLLSTCAAWASCRQRCRLRR